MRGSVHYDLDVPDFSKGALSLSGVVLTSDAVGAPLTGDVQFWQTLTSAPPTTEREFSSKDEVTAFVEIYTNDQKPGGRLDIWTTIENEKTTVFFTHKESLLVDMAQGKSGTYRHEAPIYLPSIPSGKYLLKVRAESTGAPGRPVIRQIPIAIR